MFVTVSELRNHVSVFFYTDPGSGMKKKSVPVFQQFCSCAGAPGPQGGARPTDARGRVERS